MMSGMYAAISGLDAHQTLLDVTANNLANVDTIGYKAQRTTFVDQLSQQVRASTAMTTTGANTSGVVQSVEFTSSGPTLTINGTSGIDSSAVNEVS